MRIIHFKETMENFVKFGVLSEIVKATRYSLSCMLGFCEK